MDITNPNCEVKAVNHAWLELTNTCNLRCSHCYTSSGPTVEDINPLTLSEQISLLEDLRRLGCRTLSLIGGEATLNKDIEEIILRSFQLGFSIELYSNLTRVNDDLWGAIVNYRVRLATSIYADTADIHDEITKRRGSHRSTVKNIKRAVEYMIPIRVSMIVMDFNEHRIKQTKLFVEELKVHQFGIGRSRKFGRLEVPGRGKDEIATELCGKCCNGSVCISPSGEVSPCIMSKAWGAGSIKDSSMTEIYRSGHLETVRRDLAERFNNGRKTSFNSCSPEDNCSPGACKPQFDGPSVCGPADECMPWITGDDDDDHHRSLIL